MLGSSVFVGRQPVPRGWGPASPKILRHLHAGPQPSETASSTLCMVTKLGVRKILHGRPRMLARDLYAAAKINLLVCITCFSWFHISTVYLANLILLQSIVNCMYCSIVCYVDATLCRPFLSVSSLTCQPLSTCVARWSSGYWTPVLRSTGRGFDFRQPRCRVQPWASYLHICASVTKQHNLIPVNGR